MLKCDEFCHIIVSFFGIFDELVRFDQIHHTVAALG